MAGASAAILSFLPRQPIAYQAPAAVNDDGPALSVSKLRRTFLNDVSAKSAENSEAAMGERYFHAVQFSADELKTFEARGQPPIVYNRIKRKVNTVVGILEKLPMGPKADPRTPNRAADDGATIATQALLYAMGWDWTMLSLQCARRCTIRGIAGAEIVLTMGPDGEPDVAWDEVDQRDFFYDARSSKADFSDARRMGTTRWTDVEEAVAKWPEFEDEIRGYVENGPLSDYERGDERGQIAWISKPDQRVRIVDQWFRRGDTWHYCIYCGNTALEWGESPFRDERGRSTHKFEMFSYEVDQDGDRYGIYRDLKGPQDEINHRRSKALHQLHSRRVIAEEGAVDDVEVARREYARVDGWVVKNPGKEIVTEDAQAKAVVDGNLQMLQEAKAEIDTYGPNPGLVGTDIPADSGYAIQLLQAAGIAEMGTFIVEFRKWRLRCYRKTWNTIQQVWTAPRWIKVTDNEELGQFIQLNGWQKDEFGRPVALNQLSALDMDIGIDEGPSADLAMRSTLDTVLALGAKGLQIPPKAMTQIILELSPLPSNIKQKILKAIEEAEKPSPMDQQAIMMKFQQVEAQINELLAKTQKTNAEASKILVETQALMQGENPTAQIDTPADLAAARLDLAKAAEIEQKVMTGANLPQQAPPQPPEPGLFAVNIARAQEHEAGAQSKRMQALESLMRARTIAEAPRGMLQRPAPAKPVAA
jgi:hypothetical protein